MKSLRLMIALVCFIALSQTAAQAQNAQILNVNLNLSGAASDAAYNEVTGVGVDTFEVWVEVLLSDTVTVDKLHLSMLSTATRPTTYLNNAFIVQGNHAAPLGTAYSRIGNIATINLGKYWGTKEYKLLVKEEYSNGQMSAEVIY